MSTILSFSRDPYRQPRRAAPAAGECRIVIFPGIRRERHDGGGDGRPADDPERGGPSALDGSRRPRKSS